MTVVVKLVVVVVVAALAELPVGRALPFDRIGAVGGCSGGGQPCDLSPDPHPFFIALATGAHWPERAGYPDQDAIIRGLAQSLDWA